MPKNAIKKQKNKNCLKSNGYIEINSDFMGNFEE